MKSLRYGIQRNSFTKLKRFVLKKLILIAIISVGGILPASGQNYVTLGLGYSLGVFESKDLELFTKTYNEVNRPYMLDPMGGFRVPMGVQGTVGFRHFSPLNYAVRVGYQFFISKDFAHFQNFDRRDYSLTIQSVFLELESGYMIHDFFFNGLTTFSFFRKVKMKSSYKGYQELSALDGTYSADPHTSSDVGVHFGYFKDPFILSLKVTYPVYTGGENAVLVDPNPKKVALHTEKFPDDFESSLFSQPYKGVASNIDGLKIIISLILTFEK